MKSSLECVISTSLILLSAVTGRITNPPMNAVAEVGGQAIFNCTSDLTAQNWFFSMTREDAENSAAQILIVFGCVVQSPFTNHYEVGRPGGNNTCNLIVKATTLQAAGVYTCSDVSLGPSAILTVIDQDALITVNSQPETVEGDMVTMSYTVKYNTSTASYKTPTIQPMLSWIDSDGNDVTASNYTETTNSSTSNISVTAGRQDIPPYTCRITYEIKWPSPPTGLSFANNTPSSLSNPPSTSIIKVLYGPSAPIINISTQSESVNGVNCDVNVLSCNSSGNPLPMYRWFDANQSLSNVISEEQNVSYAEANHNYICEAYNTIRYVMHTNSSNYVVVVPANFTNNSYCEMNNDLTDTHLLRTILLAAILGGYGLLNIIATIAFLVYYTRKSKKAKLNARFSWLQNMLPCMNETRGNVGCKFISVILFVLMSLLAGIIVFPILVAIANCSRRSSVSMGNSNIGMRDAAYDNDMSPNSKAAESQSTAAHGDVDAHYDVIRNTKHTADDYTDATSNGAKKMVPYTIVQTNGNTADDVDRYYVSLPDTIEKKS